METAEKRAVTPARKASGVEGVNARQVVREIRKLAIEYEQHGDPFYVTVWTAPELAENTTVPEYDPTSDTGYQRLPKNPRVHRAARYLEAGGKFPGAILLSIRGKDRNRISVQRVREDGTARLVELTIPEGVVIYLVDGQHRKFAVMEAIEDGSRLENFGLASVIFLSEDEIDEAEQFRTIHKEQKNVPTDLVDRILDRAVEQNRVSPVTLRQQGEFKKVRDLMAIRVARLLGEIAGSPWIGRIKPPNEGLLVNAAKEAGQEPPTWELNEASLKTSLGPVVELLDGRNAEEMADFLIAYWQAVVEVCPVAWRDETGYPYLHNTKGIYVLHAFFPACFVHSATLEGGPTMENFATILQKAGVDDDLFKEGGELVNIGGWGGFKNKAQELVSNLAD
jgi:DGQHR domain-containing protein